MNSLRFIFVAIFSVFLVACQPQAPVQPSSEITNTPTTTQAVNEPVVEVPATNNQSPANRPETKPAPAAEPEPQAPSTTPVAATVNLSVPFTSQAPYQVWDELHGEACEEASMIMVDAYFNGKSLGKHDAEQAILNLVSWQEERGYKVDATAAEVVTILKTYFDLNASVTTEVTVDRIKKELSAGNLIIVPAGGRLLGNPNFQTPGPIYHMLVIRGYDGKDFITNDPGTRNGEGYRYRHATLINAIHDWHHGLAEGGMTDAEIASTQKVMIVITK